MGRKTTLSDRLADILGRVAVHKGVLRIRYAGPLLILSESL